MDIRHCIVRVGIGSGVLVQGKNDVHYILTCTHVLGEDWQKIPIAFCDEKGLFLIETLTKVVTDPAPVSAEDIALIECQPELPAYYQPVKLLCSQHGWELPAYTYGFPDAFAKNGRDDRCRISKNSIHNDQGFEMLRLSESHAMKGGFSGSPLLDARYHHCLGIVCALERPDIDHQGTLIYAVPSEDIAAYFTNYLEVQSISPYLARLRSMYQEVVLNDPKGMTLADIYVESFYGVHRYCFKEKDERLDEDKNKPFVNFKTSLHHDLLRLLNQEDCLKLDGKKPGLILLLGYPGQGKTSFCKRLIYDLTGASSMTFEHIYFVRLRNLVNPADLANNPLKVIQTEIEDEVDTPPINWNNSLLILDGMDELNIKDGFQGSKIDDICKSLEQACEKYTGLRILLSSRYGYIDLDALKKRNITILRLEEFSIDQQKNWLEKYRAERFHPESPLSPEKLEEYHKHASIKELLGQAILLHMIASLEEDASGKPNRAAIYDSLFTQLVNRTWSDHGQISILKDIGLDKKMLRYALQDIAHAIFMSGKGYLRRADLEKLPKVKTIQDKLNQNNRGLDLWRTVMIAAYMDEKKKLREDQDEQDQAAYGIEFLHKSLYEYLCAEKMWREISNGFLDKSRDGDFFIKDGNKALELVFDIFSSNFISQEIYEYLIEIISNVNQQNEKELLLERMYLFFTYCLERHFLFKFDSSTNELPFKKALATFMGYWSIMVSLCPDKIISHDAKNSKIISDFFGKFFSHHFINNFNLSHQIFHEFSILGGFFPNHDFSHTDFINASMYSSYFKAANMHSVNLKKAFLYWSNFGDANLENANLAESHCAKTFFVSANLSCANLIGANFSGSDLSRSSLCYAILDHADLSGADLSYADVRNATFNNTMLNNVDFTGTAISFDQLKDAQTLYLSRGIPEVLLNELINYKPSLFEDEIPF